MRKGNKEDIGWVPIFGDFEIKEGTIRFKGKHIPASTSDEPLSAEGKEKGQAMFGFLLSSLTLADGDLSAEVEFENVTSETICELAVSYDPNTGHVVTAGLGGVSGKMFTIRELGSPRNMGPGPWLYHRFGGDRTGLQPRKKYKLEVHFRGTIVALDINGVTVAMTNEVFPPMGRSRQVGIVCNGEHLITIQNFNVNALKPKAFVVMKFSGEYDDVYKDVIKEICEDYEVIVRRADEMTGPGFIINDIVYEIQSSQLVIADITPTDNPNVYFEVGYAVALRKPTILLAKKGTSLPFDIAGFRVLFYENSIGGKSKLEEGLRQHLNLILSGTLI